MQSLFQQWVAFLDENYPVVEQELGYKFYRSPNIRKDMIMALVFWKYVRSLIRYRTTETPQQIRNFLKDFFEHENELIQIIAIFESLPDEVYQKVLWRGNIDLPGSSIPAHSFEAFLRRINPEQKGLIRTTYDEFFVTQLSWPEIPTVYKKRVHDYFRFSSNSNLLIQVRDGEYGGEDRWMTRDAWAYSLLSLDFGFGLYPKGVNSDHMITNKKFTRFLSIKENIKDFVVNQYDGTYWALYKTARSNYVLFPNKDVELKSHVCPGFWWTLIVHLIFWVVSPILFGVTVAHWANHGAVLQFSKMWYMLAALFPTPLYIVAAAVKAIVLFIADHSGVVGQGFHFLGKKIGKWSEQHKRLTSFIVWTVVSVVAVVAVKYTVKLLSWVIPKVWHFFAVIHLSPSTRVLLLVTAMVNLVCLVIIKFELNSWYRYNDVPKWIKSSTVFASLLAVANLYDHYCSAGVNHWFSQKYHWIISFPYTTGLIVAVVASLTVGTWSMLQTLSVESEGKFAKSTIPIRVLVFVLATAVIALFLNAFKQEGLLIETSFGPMLTVLGGLGLMTLWMSYLYTVEINLDTLGTRTESRDLLDTLYSIQGIGRDSDLLKGESKISFKKLLQNKWLMKLGGGERYQFLSELSDAYGGLVARMYDDKDDKILRNRFFRRFISVLNSQENCDLILATVTEISERIVRDSLSEDYSSTLYYCDHNEILDMISYVLAGMTLDEAIEEVTKQSKLKKEARAARSEKWESIGDWWMKWVIDPLVWFFVGILKIIWTILKLIAWPFIKFGKWAYRSFFTLKDLLSLFNERCPKISFAKRLE